ncbi:hypothetical protein GF420_00460 [candidate division GN15 bacterium]|jgi:hypothetical protein|nr:hypothetical protein [candidate division GN15 bacterium]
MSSIFDEEYDLSAIIVKPLYFGMFVNIIVPMILLALCYHLNNTQQVNNKVGDMANLLFYVFAAGAVLEAVAALLLRQRMLKAPMIRRKETFEEDFGEQLNKRSRVVFVIIASISLWGIIYFFLTARFTEAVLFVVLSFIVFQLVRPRYGSTRKFVEAQEKLVAEGKFLQE